MTLRVVTPPSADPVSLQEAKMHLRVDGTGEDDHIASLIAAATLQAQSLTQRLFVTQTVEWVTSGWPCRSLQLPLAPVDATEGIEWVKCVPYGGAQQTLDPSLYVVRPCGPSAVIYPSYGSYWPVLDPWAAEPVVVRFEAGTAADQVPANVKAAIKLLVGHYYANREAVGADSITDLPLGASSLLSSEAWG